MAQFKEWLINEDGFGGGSGGNSWDVLYPTYADDYPYAAGEPLSHFWLQWRWQRGEEIGRPLYNIDNKEFQKRGYVGVASNMPDAGDGFWEHKPDDGSGSLKPYKLQDLKWIVLGKDSKSVKYVDDSDSSRIWTCYGGKHTLLKDTDLDKIFGDRDSHSHKWPTIDPEYMDADWTLLQHQNISEGFKSWLEYGGGGGAATSVMHGGILPPTGSSTNDNMPVRSKYTTSVADSKSGEDTRPRTDKNGNPSTVDSEWLGKKRTPLSKRPRERKSMWIDKNRRNVPTRDDRPDIVY